MIVINYYLHTSLTVLCVRENSVICRCLAWMLVSMFDLLQAWIKENELIKALIKLLISFVYKFQIFLTEISY